MNLRITFAALAFCSGAAALSHELLWTRRLIDLLGATEWVTGRVLGLFFLGLALGGWLASRWESADSLPAWRLGLAEFLIALLSVPALLLPVWADGMIVAMGPEALVSWQGSLCKLLLSMVVVLPPAIAMGTTMPLFILVSTDLGGNVKQAGIALYAVNMLGGVFGLWLVSTVLLERVGVQGMMGLTAAINIGIGSTAVLLTRNVGRFKQQRNSIAKQDEVPFSGQFSGRLSWGLLALAFLSGFFVLALEVYVLRLMGLVAPSSFQTTSALLANVILFLFLGAIAVLFLNRAGISNWVQIVVGLVGAAAFCLFCPVILYYTTGKLVSLRYLVALDGNTLSSLNQYWMLLLSTIAIAGGATLFFAGLIFPTVLSISSQNDPAGRSIGLLLAVNGLGGLLGCELANGILLSSFGVYGGFVVLAVCFGCAAVVLCAVNRWGVGGIVVVVIMMSLTVPGISSYRSLQYISPRSKTKYAVEHTVFGPEGVLLVVNDRQNSKSMLLNNQYILGSTGVATIERRQLLLPWMLHPDSRNVCCLGLATGISASGLETLANPPAVTAVELSENVAKAARQYFSDESLGFFQRSSNRVVVEDARTFIAAASEQYDLVVADLFRPHGVGEGRLFSVEHFQNAKDALRAGGMFCQWLPAHQLNERQFKMIAATFQSVFPNTLVVLGGTLTRTPSIGLCAWKDNEPWETKKMTSNIQRMRKLGTVSDNLILNAQLLIAGVLRKNAFASTPVNTLNNSRLELEAGRFWLLKDLRPNRTADNLENGFLSGHNFKPFLQRLFQDTEPILDPVRRTQLLKVLR